MSSPLAASKRRRTPNHEDWHKVGSGTRRRPSNPDEDIIKVIVGEDEPEESFFRYHRLTKYSLFCEEALSLDWLEGRENTIRLPEDDPLLFEAFQTFVHRRIVEIDLGDDLGDDQEDDSSDPRTDRLISLWILGDKLISQTFQDAVVDRLAEILHHEGSQDFHPKPRPQDVYPITTGPSGLRRLLVDLAFHHWAHAEMADIPVDESWNEFFRDFSARVSKDEELEREGSLVQTLGCTYHDHGEDDVCYLELE